MLKPGDVIVQQAERFFGRHAPGGLGCCLVVAVMPTDVKSALVDVLAASGRLEVLSYTDVIRNWRTLDSWT